MAEANTNSLDTVADKVSDQRGKLFQVQSILELALLQLRNAPEPEGRPGQAEVYPAIQAASEILRKANSSLDDCWADLRTFKTEAQS